MEKRRRIFLAVTALLVAATAMRHPSVDIRVLAHDADDRSPVRVQAALDLGLAGVSVLVTWTAHRLTH